MSKIRPLVVIKKAHNILEFDNAVKNVLSGFDQLWFNYYPIHKTNQLMREAFLEVYKKHTHLIILCDDLIVNKESVDKIVKHAENGLGFVCGVANYDNTPVKRNFLNVSMKLAGRKRPYVFDNIIMGSDLHRQILSQPQPVKIKHMGEPFPIIRRDIAEQFSFNLDDKIHNLPALAGMNNDVVMSNEADDLGIPIWCDFTAFFYHMKLSDAKMLLSLVGARSSYTQFVPAKT